MLVDYFLHDLVIKFPLGDDVGGGSSISVGLVLLFTVFLGHFILHA